MGKKCNCSMCGKSVDEFLNNLELKIDEMGWAVIYVDGTRPIAYTIGLFKNYKHPELFLYNKNYEDSLNILNKIAQKIQLGSIYESGDELVDTNLNLNLKFRVCKEQASNLHLITRYYGFLINILEVITE